MPHYKGSRSMSCSIWLIFNHILILKIIVYCDSIVLTLLHSRTTVGLKGYTSDLAKPS